MFKSCSISNKIKWRCDGRLFQASGLAKQKLCSANFVLVPGVTGGCISGIKTSPCIRLKKNTGKFCLLFTRSIIVITGQSRTVTFAVSSVTSLVACACATLIRAACSAPATVDILSVNKQITCFAFHSSLHYLPIHTHSYTPCLQVGPIS